MISSVVIQVIPHEKQRYETCGDWETVGNALKISVSETGNWKYNMAVAVHELVEALLCVDLGITQDQVDTFDKAFEAKRATGNIDEPGDDPLAPYQLEHGVATAVERILMAEFGENWKDYETTINNL